MARSKTISQDNKDNILERVLKFYTENGINELKVQMRDVDINISKNQLSSNKYAEKVVITEQENLVIEKKDQSGIFTVTAPMVGVFYNSPNPDSPPYIKEGDFVQKGDVIGSIEVMKTFSELRVDVAGVIKDILVINGQMIEHGQNLVRIVPQ